MLPFSRDEFFEVFARYNEAVWPAQIAAYAVAAAVMVALFSGRAGRDRLILLLLSAMWVWTGIAYHAFFFSEINGAAYGFAGLFVGQGIVFIVLALGGKAVDFGWRGDAAGWAGMFMVFYAAVAYPLVGIVAGEAYPAMPLFGVTPCPVTVFTFGVLLLARRSVRLRVVLVPAIWSVVGGSAALLLSVPQDWMLPVDAVVAIPLLVMKGRRAGPGGRSAVARDFRGG